MSCVCRRSYYGYPLLCVQVILADVDVALSNDRVSGLTLWHFFDFKVRVGRLDRQMDG